MKLIIQIPCYNEEKTLPLVLADLPKAIDGIDCIEIQVIDDGSTDATCQVAAEMGVDHIIRNKNNKGLARSFQRGIDHALAQQADIIVNTDGDNQYDGTTIPDLIKPIVDGSADIVIGDRNPAENKDFSLFKRLMQKFGSRVVSRLAGVEIDDSVSGFRAYSRQAAQTIHVMTTFSYTTETLIHAGQQGLAIQSVPIKTNPATRPSRLFTSIRMFVTKQAVTILRSYIMYRALRVFFLLGFFMMTVGSVPIIRFLYYYFMGSGEGKIQSLIIGSVFLMAGFMTMVMAFLGDAIAGTRKLSETLLVRLQRLEEKLDKENRD